MELLQEAFRRLAALQPAAAGPLKVNSDPGIGHLKPTNARQERRLNGTSPSVGLLNKSGTNLVTLNAQSKGRPASRFLAKATLNK
jgi:hypothetical protein